jgi:hypothetical protein
MYRVKCVYNYGSRLVTFSAPTREPIVIYRKVVSPTRAKVLKVSFNEPTNSESKEDRSN